MTMEYFSGAQLLLVVFWAVLIIPHSFLNFTSIPLFESGRLFSSQSNAEEVPSSPVTNMPLVFLNQTDTNNKNLDR